MADDAAAPGGELSESTATDETSSATEPEEGGSEISDAVVTDVAAADEATDADEEAEEAAPA